MAWARDLHTGSAVVKVSEGVMVEEEAAQEESDTCTGIETYSIIPPNQRNF